METSFYFDHNASHHLAPSVASSLQLLARLGNSQSLHSDGRRAKSYLLEMEDFLPQVFLPESCGLGPRHRKLHQVDFHQSASACITTALKSFHQFFPQGTVVAVATDHSVVLNTLKVLKGPTHVLSVDGQGLPRYEELEAFAEKPMLLNVTGVNNETGYLWQSEKFGEVLKTFLRPEDVFMHGDFSQVPGKISAQDLKGWTTFWENFPNLHLSLTFSGHKFGALPGLGFTCRFSNRFSNRFSEDWKWPEMISGGKTSGELLRFAGTPPVYTVNSIKVAFEEVLKNRSYALQMSLLRDDFENELKKLPTHIFDQAPRALNTSLSIFCPLQSDKILMHADQAGISLSAGSACSSGKLRKGHVLPAMGKEEWAFHSLRLSLPLFPVHALAYEKAGVEKLLSVYAPSHRMIQA